MKIIIAGGGKVGAKLTRMLSAEEHEIVLIDSKSKVAGETVNQFDVMTVQGNCASVEVLEQANVEEAELLIAVTGTDEVNLLCCLTAHYMNKEIHTIARIRSPEYSGQISRMRGAFALSMVVNPEMQAAREIDRLLRFPGFLKRDTFARNRVEIVELRVNEDSVLDGLSLSSLENVAKCKVLVCTVLRNGNAVAPDGSFVLKEGDRIFVTAPTYNLSLLLKNLGILPRKVKKVLICGGGRLSYYLAMMLQKSGMGVKLVEKNYERSVELAKLFPKADIVCGDATDWSFLESEGVSHYDAVVALTGMDEMNMVISLYGGKSGVPQVITKLVHMQSSVLGDLPLGSIIDPKELCSNLIVKYVRSLTNQDCAAITVHSIADGQAEAEEFRIDKASRYCGVPLKELNLKKNVLIVCINHGAELVIPSGDSSYEQGDTVIVVNSRQEVISQFNDIFEY